MLPCPSTLECTAGNKLLLHCSSPYSCALYFCFPSPISLLKQLQQPELLTLGGFGLGLFLFFLLAQHISNFIVFLGIAIYFPLHGFLLSSVFCSSQ